MTIIKYFSVPFLSLPAFRHTFSSSVMYGYCTDPRLTLITAQPQRKWRVSFYMCYHTKDTHIIGNNRVLRTIHSKTPFWEYGRDFESYPTFSSQGWFWVFLDSNNRPEKWNPYVKKESFINENGRQVICLRFDAIKKKNPEFLQSWIHWWRSRRVGCGFCILCTTIQRCTVPRRDVPLAAGISPEWGWVIWELPKAVLRPPKKEPSNPGHVVIL